MGVKTISRNFRGLQSSNFSFMGGHREMDEKDIQNGPDLAKNHHFERGSSLLFQTFVQEM